MKDAYKWSANYGEPPQKVELGEDSEKKPRIPTASARARRLMIAVDKQQARRKRWKKNWTA